MKSPNVISYDQKRIIKLFFNNHKFYWILYNIYKLASASVAKISPKMETKVLVILIAIVCLISSYNFFAFHFEKEDGVQKNQHLIKKEKQFLIELSHDQQKNEYSSPNQLKIGIQNSKSSRKLIQIPLPNPALFPVNLPTLLTGITQANTASTSFTSPLLSLGISNGISLAIGGNAGTSAGAFTGSGNGISAAQGNAAANALGLGAGIPSVSQSIAGALSATIVDRSYSDSKAVSVSQSLGLPTLNGKYELSFPEVSFQVTKSAFLFRGCKFYQVPIISQGNNKRLGVNQVQPLNCGYDHALQIAERLLRVSKFKRDEDRLDCLNQKGQKLFFVNQKKFNQKGQQVYLDFHEGEYVAQFFPLKVEINQNKLSFEGHQDRPVEFQSNNLGVVSFKKQLDKNKDLGFYDEGNSLAELLASCSRATFRGENKGFQLTDQLGKPLATCLPKKW